MAGPPPTGARGDGEPPPARATQRRLLRAASAASRSAPPAPPAAWICDSDAGGARRRLSVSPASTDPAARPQTGPARQPAPSHGAAPNLESEAPGSGGALEHVRVDAVAAGAGGRAGGEDQAALGDEVAQLQARPVQHLAPCVMRDTELEKL